VKNILFVFLLCFGFLHAQEDYTKFVSEPKWVLKFAPRIFAPKITFEKIIDKNSSAGIDTRVHAFWLPQGLRLEGFYRRYFNDNAPLGFYIQPKVALGYFDYQIVDLKTNGLQVGGGFNLGGQFNIGINKAVIDVYAGFQWIAPIYFNQEPINNNNGLIAYGYNTIHYTLMALPLDVGIRFGIIRVRKVPLTETFENDGYY
jgi:hypothetical protein